MKTTLLFFGLLFVVSQIFGQNFSWANNYDIANANEVAGFDIDDNGNTCAVGVFGAPVSLPYNGNGYILKSDNDGLQAWMKLIEGNVFFGDLTAVGNKFCIVGQAIGAISCDGISLFDSPNSYMFLLLINEDGSIQWSQQFSDKHAQFGNLESHDGIIALQSRGQFNTGDFIMHFDQQGNLIQERDITEFEAVDIAYHNGKTYLHGKGGFNEILIDNITISAPVLESSTFVVAFDENLIAMWSHAGSAINNRDGRVEANDEGVFSYQSILLENFGFSSEIWHLDLDGNLLSSINPPTFTSSVSLYPDLSVTDCNVALFAENQFDFNSHEVIIMDHDLNIIEEKTIDGESYLYSGQISEHNNQFYVAHIHSSSLSFDDELELEAFNAGTQYPYIAEISFDTGDCATNGIDELELEFNLFPNPSSSFFQVNTELINWDWFITDIQGKVLLQGLDNKLSQVINIEGIESEGLYIFSLSSKLGTSSKMFVKR